MMQELPGKLYKQAADTAVACWDLLEAIDDIIACSLSQQLWKPYTSPLIHDAPFEQPQRLHGWLLQRAKRLEAAERILYNPSSSPEAQHLAHEQLCQLSQGLHDARWIIDSWVSGYGGLFGANPQPPDEEREADPSMVLAVSKHWLGHVPWSLSLPGSKHATARQTAEALQVPPGWPADI